MSYEKADDNNYNTIAIVYFILSVLVMSGVFYKYTSDIPLLTDMIDTDLKE